jgi:16S rRNA (guanine527-N7)-methyltransferase
MNPTDWDSLAPDLAEGLAQLGLDLPAATQAKLLRYLAMIGRWNRVYNLTAVREPEAMLRQHLLDCLAALPALRRHLSSLAAPRVLDVGSGAGLPGVVLALCQPEWQVTCIDAVAKKVSFIRQVAAELGVGNLRAEHARVESLQHGGYDLVISRAFASLADFTALTAGALSPGGDWVAMKGKPAADEQVELPPSVQVFHVEPLRVPGLTAERCLVWMRRPAE